MPELMIGDKVEIVEHPTKKYIGKYGEIIHVGTGIKPVTQPVVEKLPETKLEPRYDVKLDDGRILNGLREQQLQKL